MKIKLLGIIALVFLSYQGVAQEEPELTSKDSIITSSWMFSVGWNFVDDSGDAFNDFTTIKDQWNGVIFPSRLSIGRYFESGLGLEAIASYNNYKEGNIIDGVVNPEDKTYLALDSRLSYDLNKIVGETGWFDPYVGVGLGYTKANDLGRATYNAVVGFRTWFSDHWGLDLSSSGKWSFGNEATNHIQHAIGVVYQFDVEKKLSKKGEDKLALIQELEKENQRIQDSILAAKQAEEDAKALAERLEREKERARLAAAEKAKQEAKKMGLLKLQQTLDSLGFVYFDFDSSYLNTDSKTTLDKVAELMHANPSYSFIIEAHADSRGAKEYNLWLSERRAERTVGYLADKGVAKTRLQAKGYGEENLVNHCADGVSCSSAEHRLNRRSEIGIKVNELELVNNNNSGKF